MTEQKTYYTDTGLVILVEGSTATVSLSKHRLLDSFMRLCDPVAFHADPLRNSALDLIGRQVERGQALFVLEAHRTERHFEFPAPLTGTIEDANTHLFVNRLDAPPPILATIRLSKPEELKELPTTPPPLALNVEQALQPSGREMDVLKQYPSILKSLGGTGARIFHIQKVGDQFLFIDACDWHYNVTLTKEQLLRLSDELRRMTEIDDVDPHFLEEYVD